MACIGETMALLTPHPPGELEHASTLSLHAAGAESNVAQYLADHGVAACWVSRVGDDPFGRLVRREVATGGVDVDAEVDPSRPTGVYFKHQGPAGTEVRYYRRGSAAAAMTPAILDRPMVRAAGALHLSGITPALSDSCHDLVAAALQPGPNRAPLISFDVNWRPPLWAGGTDEPGDVLAGLARRADLVFVGLDEAATLWGCTGPAAVREVLPEPRLLVVKDGSLAATAFDRANVAEVTVPALAVEVVDEVGAGDAFAAGVLAGAFRGLDLRGQLRLGHLTAVAALRVATDHGPLLDAATIDLLLRCEEESWASTRFPTPAAAAAAVAAQPAGRTGAEPAGSRG